MLVAGAGASGVAWAAEASEGLADLSLEQLGDVRISSVSRRTERLQDAAASVFVIGAEQIRRSGARTLPEALRLAPNLNVAQSSASSWVISARGLNNAGNKMLVLIDGRIVYSPLYSGVLWDAQDVALGDVERIEVISGPGGTLWGSNAVNGVISIITRRSEETQGAYARVGGGGGESMASVRYGGALGASGHFRLYAQGTRFPHTRRSDGVALADDWSREQAGFRTDWGDAADGITLQGDAYQARIGQPNVNDDQLLSGFNMLARWSRVGDGGQRLQVQAYFDHVTRSVGSAGNNLFQRLKISDLSFQHNLVPGETHTVIWGGGLRRVDDHILNTPVLAFLPGDRTDTWANAYVQDEVGLRDDLTLTAGVKLERNPYTGTEVLPSLRLAWKPADNRLLWGALSRVVRTPSRLDRDLFSPATPRAAPLPPFVIAGGPDFRSEVSRVAELGWRAQPSPAWNYSVTGFHHVYERLRSVEIVNDPVYALPYAVVGNEMAGTGTGLEAWGTWQVMPRWSLSLGGTWLNQQLHLRPGSTDTTGTRAAGNDPRFQLTLNSALELPAGMELQVAARRVGALPAPAVPAYTAVDLRLGWRVHASLELALAVRNLFDRGHVEFGALPGASEIERRVFVGLTWKL